MERTKKAIVKYSGRIIGSIYRGKTITVFIKNVIPEKHLLKQGNAYGIQSCVYNKLLSNKKGFIRINELEKPKRQLEAPIKTWDKKGWVNDLGSGKQRFLSIDRMEDKNIKIKQ